MKGETKYRGFEIYSDPPPIPTRAHDWAFVHEDYDGPGDNRHGTGRSVEDCHTQIDEMIEDEEA